VLEHIPAANKCNKYTIPDNVNVGDILNQIYSPQGKVTEYEGNVKLQWNSQPDYAFKVGKTLIDSTPQELYFDEQSMNLNFVQFENQPYVLTLPNGI